MIGIYVFVSVNDRSLSVTCTAVGAPAGDRFEFDALRVFGRVTKCTPGRHLRPAERYSDLLLSTRLALPLWLKLRRGAFTWVATNTVRSRAYGR